MASGAFVRNKHTVMLAACLPVFHLYALRVVAGIVGVLLLPGPRYCSLMKHFHRPDL